MPAPSRSPNGASPETLAHAPNFDLGIHVPNSPVLLPPGPSRGEERDAGGDAYAQRHVSALTSWNMARQLSLRNRHRTARAVSSSLLSSNSVTASDLVAMDDGASDTPPDAMPAETSPHPPAAPAYVGFWAQPVHSHAAAYGGDAEAPGAS